MGRDSGHDARGSGYCAKCLQREIDRRTRRGWRGFVEPFIFAKVPLAMPAGRVYRHRSGDGHGAIDRRVAQCGADRRGGARAGVGVVRHTHAATIAVRGTGVESFGCPARPRAELPDGGTTPREMIETMQVLGTVVVTAGALGSVVVVSTTEVLRSVHGCQEARHPRQVRMTPVW